MLNREKFISLLDKYASEKISAEERSEFLAAVTTGLFDDVLLQHIEGNLISNNAAGAGLPPHRSQEMLHKIISSEKQNALIIPARPFKKRVLRLSVAAAIIAALLFSAYLITSYFNKNTISNASFAEGLLEKKNNTAIPLKITMEEGSIITLQPNATIHYPAHFLLDKREIFLEGEAFFEVSKNALRPFFVYNKNIVTHVLGTSFSVKINKETQQVEVAVKTGRVEVYENKNAVKMPAGNKGNGVILLPNQKVIYYQDTRQFVPSLVEVPLPVAEETANKNTAPESFVFEETPLKKVLQSLSKTYGIDLVVENDNVYKCLFTGDVSQQDLYTRLDIICQAVQASYEVKGTKILIKGNGCN